jgi:trehalose 6-phosphate phosphatase
MKNLLAKGSADALFRLAHGRCLLAFDFDGTLAPIVDRPDQARMRDETAALFATVCSLYPCAVISGRSVDDVSSKLGKVGAKYVIGNHGLEPGPNLAKYEREMLVVRRALVTSLEQVPGVDLEDKRYSLALHYRHARRKYETYLTIERAIARTRLPIRMVLGKEVVNVVPAGAPNKGDALERLSNIEGCDTTLYVGDDLTDEDVFRLGVDEEFQSGDLLTVRVGQSPSSAASYFLGNQQEIDRLLAMLVWLREQRLPS